MIYTSQLNTPRQPANELRAAGDFAAAAPPGAPLIRPAKWAQPVAAVVELPNLYRVNSNLYRSAQPTEAGFRLLDSQVSLANGDRPVKTILSLRAVNGNAHLQMPDSTLRFEQIRFDARMPEDQDAIRFLQIVRSPQLQPVLVHCQRGADRTGSMLAVYRMVVDNWTVAQALREMADGGYGFNPLCQNLLQYVRTVDIASLKTQIARQRERR
jgi:protein tyrosine/serine phosphatase